MDRGVAIIHPPIAHFSSSARVSAYRIMPMPWKAAASVNEALQLYDLQKGLPWI